MNKKEWFETLDTKLQIFEIHLKRVVKDYEDVKTHLREHYED